MNPDWRAFLTARGARGGDDDRLQPPPPTGGREPPADCARYDLSHLGLIRVAGADADTFLQGQLSNDLRALTPTHSQLSCHCSPKGRMLALFRVLRGADGIDLQLPRERVAEAIKRLLLYVLRAKVTLTDLSDGPVRIGLSGVGAPAQLERLGLPVPAADNALITAAAVRVLRLPAPVPRFELIADYATQSALWDALTPVSTWGDEDAWALLDIRAGIPSVYTATVEAFVPRWPTCSCSTGSASPRGATPARRSWRGCNTWASSSAACTRPRSRAPPHRGRAMNCTPPPVPRNRPPAGWWTPARAARAATRSSPCSRSRPPRPARSAWPPTGRSCAFSPHPMALQHLPRDLSPGRRSRVTVTVAQRRCGSGFSRDETARVVRAVQVSAKAS